MEEIFLFNLPPYESFSNLSEESILSSEDEVFFENIQLRFFSLFTYRYYLVYFTIRISIFLTLFVFFLLLLSSPIFFFCLDFEVYRYIFAYLFLKFLHVFLYHLGWILIQIPLAKKLSIFSYLSQNHHPQHTNQRKIERYIERKYHVLISLELPFYIFFTFVDLLISFSCIFIFFFLQNDIFETNENCSIFLLQFNFHAYLLFSWAIVFSLFLFFLACSYVILKIYRRQKRKRNMRYIIHSHSYSQFIEEEENLYVNQTENGTYECPICLLPFGRNSKIISLPCKHVFCRKCSEKYFSKEDHLLCPLCRQNFEVQP